MARKTSDRAAAVLEFICAFIEGHGYPPTIRQIGQACNISSTSVVESDLERLERAGLIAREKGQSRTIRLLPG